MLILLFEKYIDSNTYITSNKQLHLINMLQLVTLDILELYAILCFDPIKMVEVHYQQKL